MNYTRPPQWRNFAWTSERTFGFNNLITFEERERDDGSTDTDLHFTTLHHFFSPMLHGVMAWCANASWLYSEGQKFGAVARGAKPKM